MPELPEVQAHAERLTAQFSGAELTKFVPLNFTALKTALPRPDAAYGLPLESVGRRGKYVGQYRRGAASRVRDVGGRGKANAQNQRARDKAEIFEDALARLRSSSI